VADLAEQISEGQAATGAFLRTGGLSGIAGTTLTVNVGGGQLVDMPYLDSYVPILGDVVQILQQGGVSLVIGASAAMATDNTLTNPSFELDGAGSTAITGWTAHQDVASVGSATMKVDTATGWGPKDGVQWLEINHGSAGYSGMYAVSDPVAVQPGQRWSAAGYVVSAVTDGGDEPDLSLWLAFFASSAGTYPTDLLSEERLQSINGPTGPGWVVVRAPTGTGTTVPDGATAMRVLLFTETWGGSVYWDKIVCRRVDI
jgi:hypothetical protein